MKTPSCLLALALMGCAATATQHVGYSYNRARQLLDQSIEAHGGLPALKAGRQIHFQTQGNDLLRMQSRRPIPPYDSVPASADVWIDLVNRKLIWERAFGYPGGFRNFGRMVISSENPFFLNHLQRLNYPQPGRTIDGMQDVLHLLPHLALLTALENRSGLRYLGQFTLSTGSTVEVITTSTARGQLTLAFDPNTHFLQAYLGVQADPLLGDAATETEFLDYTRVSGIMAPGRRVSRTGGEVTEEVRYTLVSTIQAIPDSLFKAPEGYVPPPVRTSGEPVRQLAPGVWAIQSAGAWSLAVAMSDYLLVVEAPASGVPDVIARLATLAPGKPVRYVIPTHHHDDHSFGVRDYVAQGATIVTTQGNRQFFERMLASRSTLRNDTATALRPRIQTITGSRVFSDQNLAVEIHDIGPGPHAEEMLVVWIPRDGILFQGDLGPTEEPVQLNTNNETTVHFAEWLKVHGWDVKVHVGVHGGPGRMAAMEEVLQQPLRTR